MRRLFVALTSAVSVVALTQMASAADLYQPVYKALPPAPPPFSWTGFYVGIDGGAGWGTVESTLNSITFSNRRPDPTININTPWSQDQINGWLFGGNVGYNWQANPWLVLGIEGDWDWTDFEGTTPCGTLNIFSCHDKVSWTADVAGRVGFTWDRALIYAKGGVAWAHTDYNSNLDFFGVQVFDTSTSDTRVGGLFGAGVEYAFLPNWSAKIEYNFMDFGTKGENFNLCFGPSGVCPGVTANANIRETISTVKVGVNYRFWGY